MDVRNPPFTMFCRRLDRGLLRAHTRPSLGPYPPAIPPVPVVRPTGAVRPIEAPKTAVCDVRNTSIRAVQLLGPNVTHRVELMRSKFVSGTVAPGAWRGRKNGSGIPICSGDLR